MFLTFSPLLKRSFYTLFILAIMSCSGGDGEGAFTTFKLRMENNFGVLEFTAPAYLDTAFYRDTLKGLTCSEEATYLFDASKDYIKKLKEDQPEPNFIHSLRIYHSAVRECDFNNKDSIISIFNMWHEGAKAHTVYFWSKIDTKNGPAYLLAHGSDGGGNALVLINVNGLLLNMSLLVSNISKGELNKTLTRIANSVVIKEN